MNTKTRFLPLAMGIGLLMLVTGATVWAQNYSHARVVRLSYVEGSVTVQRPDVADWATAPVNTPLQEGFKLMTAENSFAEVEFENASSVRLGQRALLEFTQLALLPSGGKVNRLTLQQGYATFHGIPEGEDLYEIKTPSTTLVPHGKTLFRVDLDVGVERVEVFKGSVDASSVQGYWTLARNAVLELRPGSDQPYSLSEGITKDAWDQWVEERENRATLARNNPSPGAYTNNMRELVYGWNELSAYGNWSYVPGYGYGWMPTVSYGWAPYSMGRWCWYPAFGYTWISAEPWGWLPYHYGGWSYIPGIGWYWFPDNFGFWSPGLVDWYMGPGWIGWVPRSGVVSGGRTNNCQHVQRCGTTVAVNNFQNGGSITPGSTLPVDPLQGRRVDRPELPPGVLARLPGLPLGRPAAVLPAESNRQGEPSGQPRQVMGGGPSGGSTGNPAAVGTPPRGAAPGFRWPRGTAAPQSAVVFDPVEGRYVNSPTATPTSEANKEVVGFRSNVEAPPQQTTRGEVALPPGEGGSKALGRTGAGTPSGVVGAPTKGKEPRVTPAGTRPPATTTGRPAASAPPPAPGAPSAGPPSRGEGFHRSAPGSGSGGRSSGFEGSGRVSGGGAHVSGSSGGGAHGGTTTSGSGPSH
jgi:hypothetical protein